MDNNATIRIRFDETPEIRTSQAGKPYFSAFVSLVEKDYKTGDERMAGIKLSAFGDVATKFGYCTTGRMYCVPCKIGVEEGRGKGEGKMFVSWVAQGIFAAVEPGAPAKRAAPAAPAQDDEELPF